MERSDRRASGPYRRENGTSRNGFSSLRATRPETVQSDFFPDVTPESTDESQVQFTARVGSRVVHEAFGRGRIVALDGRGENTKAVVDFDSVGKKHLMLRFAHLKEG
jgi:DNA helicase-2/ATP-dependent DNA helicase PcrA